MALKRMVLELGMGTDIRGGDYTKAAVRAVQNALRQNSLSVVDAFGFERSFMHVKILIGAQKPEEVDKDAVGSTLPYGQAEVIVKHGGMDTPSENGEHMTTMVNAALIVYLDFPNDHMYGEAA